MARKEASEKEGGKDSTAIVTVNIDDFTRTRDSVIVSLATLQSAVSDLSNAYINHANTVLNRGPANLDLGAITSTLIENGLLGGSGAGGSSALTAGAGAAAAARAAVEAGEGGKKKRKRVHDPNAPKRALTPYFLYMQHNRANIAKELGPNAKPKDVSDEGTRRWAEMPDNERSIWKKLYADNLAVYKEKVKAYKAGQRIPEDDETEAAARQLQQGVHHATEGASSSESSESEEEEEEETSPAKAKTPPRSSKRRRSEAKPATPPPPPSSSKKGKKGGKKEESAAAAASSSKKVAETPKATEKKSRKKRKSEAHED